MSDVSKSINAINVKLFEHFRIRVALSLQLQILSCDVGDRKARLDEFIRVCCDPTHNSSEAVSESIQPVV